MRVGAVIRALNEEEHIARLLVGLERQSMTIDEIVLVDSGSTDATVSIAEQFGVRVAHIDPKEFTFGRSLNRGLEVSTADVVLVLSAHVYPVFASFVERMVDPLFKREVAVAYGRQVGDSRTKFSEQRIMERWFPESGTGRQTHAFCNNANAAVRRSAWEMLRYKEELTGLEDIEFASRAQAQEWDVWYVAEAPVVHVHQESRAQIRNRYRREAIAYGRVHPGWRMNPLEAVSAATKNIASDLAHAARHGQLLQHGMGIVDFRTSQFLGAWEGGRHGHPATEELRQRMYYPAGLLPKAEDSVWAGDRIDYGHLEEKKHVD